MCENKAIKNYEAVYSWNDKIVYQIEFKNFYDPF